ncbi:MAG: N-(5'-phosphoribosyl)anthranilate isomerase [Porticoccaceae bacterium]|nr:MAG: N-(5'-phosphoribosyl)anthranilate isomerase [Porticoccaceae bacterium]
MVKIKICGITSAADARIAEAVGADAIGLVFYPQSPRAVTVAAAREIARAVGPFLTTVALFVDPPQELVEAVLAEVRPHLLQFHGDETPAFCTRFGRPYLKAIRMGAATDPAAAMARHPEAAGFVFDAWHPASPGGTGRRFDWARLTGLPRERMVLAGGLDADNVAEAVARLHPYAVDVSSGVESAPGRKDPQRMARFVRAVRGAAIAEEVS